MAALRARAMMATSPTGFAASVDTPSVSWAATQTEAKACSAEAWTRAEYSSCLPRPTSTTRWAVTPGSVRSVSVEPARPRNSVLTTARTAPLEARSMMSAAGLNTPSAYTPTARAAVLTWCREAVVCVLNSMRVSRVRLCMMRSIIPHILPCLYLNALSSARSPVTLALSFPRCSSCGSACFSCACSVKPRGATSEPTSLWCWLRCPPSPLCRPFWPCPSSSRC
ncbi:hypothetical protein D3C73_850850 [compost metagenome]